MVNVASSKMAVLLGAPHGNQVSVHHDLSMMYAALQLRGFSADEIFSLEGGLTKQLAQGFLAGIRHKITNASISELFLYFSGHGYFTGTSADTAQVGLLLNEEALSNPSERISWVEIFEALQVPNQINVVFLPDH